MYLVIPPGNSSATEQSTEDLHKRFRSVVTLTQLVSAINAGGYPTWRAFPHKINNPRGPLEVALHAMVDILGRNTEAISVAVSGSSIVVVQGLDEDPTGEPGSANEELPNPAIVNEDQHKFPDGSQCILVGSGKSHLPTELLSGDELCEHFVNAIK